MCPAMQVLLQQRLMHELICASIQGTQKGNINAAPVLHGVSDAGNTDVGMFCGDATALHEL